MDDLGSIRVLVDDKPGVDRDAVTAYAATRLQDIDAGVAVGQGDQFPHIDALLVTDERQFVGKGDIDVTEGVLGQLAHLGGAGFGRDALPFFHKHLVDLGGGGGAGLVHATDDAIVFHQLADHLTWQNPLRAVRHKDIRGLALSHSVREGQIAALFRQPFGHLLGGADRRRGFQYHQVAFLQHGGQGAGGALDIFQIRLMILALEGGRHGDQEGIGLLRAGMGTQMAILYGLLDQVFQTRFHDVDLALVDGVDRMLVDIHAHDTNAVAGDDCGSWQTDITQTHDRDGFEFHFILCSR
ncbi:hypothetical protein D3C78_548700 [compost metagenome]